LKTNTGFHELRNMSYPACVYNTSHAWY